MSYVHIYRNCLIDKRSIFEPNKKEKRKKHKLLKLDKQPEKQNKIKYCNLLLMTYIDHIF